MEDSCGIFFNISNPLGWKSKTPHSGEVVSSISRSGILANYWANDKIVEIIDIPSGNSFKITQIKRLTTPAFNQNVVFLFTEREKQVVYLDTILNKTDVTVDKLKGMEYPGCIGLCDVSSTNIFNVVKFIDISNCIDICELPNMTCQETIFCIFNSNVNMPR
eukprot:gnl/Chilomastix_caulleri/3904.p1 GENE.gnl/Chilomastix_caulleri/3904~~gnl/Chilomastix_caulleri/3904.p1  ORF type:complete len:162 (-),score=18.36 gnl/Chilomastix_caulleri/3904:65-550(-)